MGLFEWLVKKRGLMKIGGGLFLCGMFVAMILPYPSIELRIAGGVAISGLIVCIISVIFDKP